jgi:glycine/D-amino acid oxidase-like deaminating enzyme
MPTLFIVGGGLFGSPAAAYARSKGIEAVVFDAGLPGAASAAAAGLFQESWAGRKLQPHYRHALPLLERLYGIRHVTLAREDGGKESLLFVPPAAVLEPDPVRRRVTAVGDGWLEADGHHYQGWVYVAAGVWCEQFLPGLGVYSKAGSSLLFAGERPGRMRRLGPGRQAIAFVRDPGSTYFSDGTAEREYLPEHDRQTLARAAAMGLEGEPVRHLWGCRPWTAGGPVFRKLGERTWLATGGRKMGTVLGASFARRLVEDELR